MNRPSLSSAAARRTVSVVLFLAGVMIADPSIAGAHYLSHDDADDTPSRLDVRTVSLRVHRDVHRIVLTVRTYEPFKLKRDGYIYGDLDAFGDSRRDYSIKIWHDPGGAREICDLVQRHEGRASRRPPIAFDIRRRLARCQIRSGEIRRSKHMRWHVRTTRFDRFVTDSAPDGGAWFPH
jgi:hypothetical protein